MNWSIVTSAVTFFQFCILSELRTQLSKMLSKLSKMKKILKSMFRRKTVSQHDDEDLGFPGPLISGKTQKEDLIQFIKKKSETCLSETNDPDHVEEYFFWQIMELFCSRNGKVVRYEVSRLLLRLYGFIRQKFSDSKHQKNWYLPIACLLCSAAPDDENRQAVIKMGDDLASRGLTYAAHICYVVAKVELGSHAGFNLIGCRSTPFEETVLNKAIIRTETYEYILSLTSWRPQINFQIFKFNRAIHLDSLLLLDAAFAYCETISRTVIIFPSRFSRTFVGQVVQLSCSLSRKLNKESEWLLKLRNLHSSELAKANLSANEQQEECVTSTSPGVDSGFQDTEHVPICQSPDLQPQTERLSEFNNNILKKQRSTKVSGLFAQLDELNDYISFHDTVMSCCSKKMSKKDLIQFIAQKSKEFLGKNYDPDYAEDYFFWQIMELFCRQNGKVMLYEVGALLLRHYGFLRQKLKDGRHKKKWCLPMARLFCVAAPEDEIRQAVIKMGHNLAIRGLTYAAHICYVVAKVKLGSRAGFNLIGCNGMPLAAKVLDYAVLRTEAYEYVLSLTSGLPQLKFQIVKLFYAGRLAMLKHNEQAFDYCESIARTVITLPRSFSRTFVGRVLLLSCNLLQQLQLQTEPEWLLELRQLHSAKVAEANAKANAEPEQHVSPTSTDMNSDILNWRGLMTNKVPTLSAHQKQKINPKNVLKSRYTIGKVLGTGGYGSVYAAVRKKDGRKVAIKFEKKENSLSPISIPGETDKLPLEVALMMMVSRPPSCRNIVKLLEWFDFPEEVVLVLERPKQCMDLKTFLIRRNGHLSEAQARDIMLQVIRAARHCCERGVFHRDIKSLNLLINTDTMEVKLIDFGCGAVLKDTFYESFSGTVPFIPPEYVMYEKYKAIPGTIWGLGVLLYSLVYGKYPLYIKEGIRGANLTFPPGVSQEFFEVVMWCLEFNPELRPTFEDLIRHEWFKM